VTDGDAPAHRVPAGPPAAHPPGFKVQTVATGRLLENAEGDVIYSSTADRPNVSNCKDECLKQWTPMLASQIAQPQGEWGVIERSPGVKQWTFRKMPVYTYALDRRRTIVGQKGVSLIGNDVPGWRPVYTQKWPDPPKEFKIQDSRVGQVLTDKNGMTLYTYVCADDAMDELICDHPSQTQAYRLAICGRGDAAACNKLFSYVPAPKGAKVNNLIWGTAWIDPQTGHTAAPNAPGALYVWTFRDRPIYTHGRDKKPGDAWGDAWGENDGVWNGYKAIWVRDDFNGNAD
jgi:predicted lipoprotein with Yx(FWY)xxD motif